MAALQEFIAQHPEDSGIVYCSTRKQVERVTEKLRESGVSARAYHAGMSERDRRENQSEFLFDRVRVMVATNAFGMGIDKQNVGFVVHYNMPKNMESYYQESHRAASPLCVAGDAVSLDTTEMSFDETVAEIRRLALDATGKC